VDEVFREQAKGLDHKRLMSVISHLEFLNREKDFGGLPTGLVYGLTAMDGWLYGLDPALTLCRDEYYQPLRDMVEAGEYEKLLREIYLDGEHRASIVMLPSKTVADEKREKEKQRLQALKDSWTNEQVQRVIDDFRLLRERQNTPDTPEQLATLPRLGISDIPAARKPLPMQISEVAGRPLVYEDVDSSGISYVSLNFDVDDLTDDELSRLSLLSTLYGNIETENFGVTELENEMDEKLGRFSVYTQVHSGKKRFMPLLTVRFAVLDGFKQAAVELIREIMCRSKFADEKYILNLVRQQRIEAEQTIMMSGSSFAARHAASGLNELGAVREAINGIRFLRLMQNEDKHFSAKSLKWMEQLSRKVLSRDRLTLNLTGKRDDEWLQQLAQIFPCTPKGWKAEHALIDSAADGYLIPSEISFAACVGKLNASDGGTAKVASQILTYDYLWNTIRVKGGAYGTSFKISDSGTMEITSYRDPSAAASLKSFARCGEELKAFAASGESPDRFIVSTIGNIDPLRTPRTLGSEADWMYFTGTTQKELDEEWTQVLTCDKEKLAKLSAMIDDALNGANVCVIGGKTCLDKCEGVIKHTESIQ
ncbi:MAG: hypothetical protein II920_08980, partial [Clostridia bacterium]|nr:hypothetical protein [Clostridia bacterium]